MAETRLPEQGNALGDPGDGEQVRRGDASGAGRRDADQRAAGLSQVMAAVWAVAGSVVVLFLFFVALDAVDPRETRTLSLIVLVLAVLWLAHSWRRLFIGGAGSRSDRERRGF